MKEQVAKDWSAALRSGKYEQGRGVLKVTNSNLDSHYCCLGVLCDISGIGRWDHDVYVCMTEDGQMFNGTVLPLPVMKWAGLKEANPAIVPDNEQLVGLCSLAGHNDGGSTFVEIADLIDEAQAAGII